MYIQSMENLYQTTVEFIKQAHVGQMYGDSMPYWMHPVEVAEQVKQLGGSDNAVIAALLHDVVEDTEHTLKDLLTIGYGSDIVEIVDLLTKQPGSYQENIQRIIDSGNRDAMVVKLADNMRNIAGDKTHMTNERRERLLKKYDMSIRMLSDALHLRP